MKKKQKLQPVICIGNNRKRMRLLLQLPTILRLPFQPLTIQQLQTLYPHVSIKIIANCKGDVRTLQHLIRGNPEKIITTTTMTKEKKTNLVFSNLHLPSADFHAFINDYARLQLLVSSHSATNYFLDIADEFLPPHHHVSQREFSSPWIQPNRPFIANPTLFPRSSSCLWEDYYPFCELLQKNESALY